MQQTASGVARCALNGRHVHHGKYFRYTTHTEKALQVDNALMH